MRPEDRDYTTFFWPEDPWDPNSKLVTYRFKVVLFGATCSQFLLNATILHHLRHKSEAVAGSIRRNCYIDNIQNSFISEDEMLNFYNEANNLMAEAGFPLREWVSTSLKMNDYCKLNGKFTKQEGTYKMLGYNWDPASDIVFVKSITEKEKLKSKRDIVSEASRVYDPLGFALPVTIGARIFVQKLWKNNFTWDEPLPKPILDEWSSILHSLKNLHQVKIPREVLGRNPSLDIYSDASQQAYGCAAYISSEGTTNLILARSRVAPIRELSLPQLELMGVTLASRLVRFIIEAYSQEFVFESINIWTDSKIVLSWMSTTKVMKQFVKSRVDEIKLNTQGVNLQYIPGAMNPADKITRGITLERLKHDCDWFHGPQWNTDIVSDASSATLGLPSVDETIREEGTQTEIKASDDDEVFSIHRFSSFSELLSLVATVKMCVTKFLNKIGYKLDEDRNRVYHQAKSYLIKRCQQNHFPKEHAYLMGNLCKVPCLVKQLGLYFDEGKVIRCRGRLQFADNVKESGDPILLPRSSHVTRLIILHIHHIKMHSGTSYVLAEVRKLYWIPSCRQTIKGILRKCVVCNKIQSRAFKQPPHAPLPMERVAQARPFKVTGLDYTGALYVRGPVGITDKVYIALFTCAVTRAIHLEIVEDCSEAEFLLAFRRFVSRRSIPSLVISDNAKTFEAANRTLDSLFKHDSVRRYAEERGIRWKMHS